MKNCHTNEFITTRQKTEIRNAFVKNMSRDIKLSKVQLSQIIQSCGFPGNKMSNLDKKSLIDLPVALAEDIFPKIATKATSSILGKFEKNIKREGAVRTGKGFTLFISNEDIDDASKTVESQEKSGPLIDGASQQ